MLGNVISTQILDKSAGSYRENIDMRTYNCGIYFIEVFVDGKITTKKIIKKYAFFIKKMQTILLTIN